MVGIAQLKIPLLKIFPALKHADVEIILLLNDC